MKKLQLLTLVLASALSFSMHAQHDVKINITNVFLYEANINYEYILNDYATIGGLGGYVYDFPDVSDPNKYWYVGPEFRYYVSPKNGADRFFIGLYSRFKSGSAYVNFNESGLASDGSQYLYYYQEDKTDYTKLAIGFTLGGKWINRNGLVYGVFGGVGRNLFASYDESSFDSHESEYDPNSYFTSTSSNRDNRYWDFRIGFNVGWRFGK
jgi:hypothetical protein